MTDREICAELAAITTAIGTVLQGHADRQYCLEDVEMRLTALLGHIRTTYEPPGAQPPSHGAGAALPADHHA